MYSDGERGSEMSDTQGRTKVREMGSEKSTKDALEIKQRDGINCTCSCHSFSQ